MGKAEPDPVVVGIDVGSTTVKAVVVDPDTHEILWSDYQRHQTKQPEKVLELLEAIARGVPRSPAATAGASSSPARARRRSRAAPAASSCRRSTRSRWRSSTSTPTSARSSSSAGRTRRSSCSRRTRRPATRPRTPSMNDKCASGTGATIDKCLLKVERAAGARHDAPLRRLEAPPRRGQVRRVRRDRHRQPGQERHPVERGPLLARRRDRPAEPLRAHARQHAEAQGAPARRPEHVPAVPPGVLAPAHPADLGRARLRLPEGRPDRGARSSSRRTRSTTPRSARCCSASTRPAHVGALHAASTASTSTSRHGRKARLGETRRPAARRRRASELDDVPRALQDPEVRRREARGRAGGPRRHRPRRRLDVVEGRARRRETAKILNKAYQLSKGNPIQDTKELLARAAATYVDRPGRRRSR